MKLLRSKIRFGQMTDRTTRHHVTLDAFENMLAILLVEDGRPVTEAEARLHRALEAVEREKAEAGEA